MTRTGRVCGTPLQPIGYFSKGQGSRRKVHPVFARSTGTRRISGVSPYPQQPKTPTVHARTLQRRVLPSKVKVAKPVLPEKGEARLNAKVFHGLERKYGPDKTGRIIQQAQESYHYRAPQATTNPETYELFEGGNIDEAIESLGFPRWVIGRPNATHLQCPPDCSCDRCKQVVKA